MVAAILLVAYVRNDRIYPVFQVSEPDYPLFLAYEDLKSALPVGTMARDIPNGLRVYTNTYWSYEMNFSQPKSVWVLMTAKGSPVQNIYPVVTMTLDHELPVILNIDTPEWKTFRKTFSAPAGKHILTVAFENDAFQYPEDRNLDIQSLCIGTTEDCRPSCEKRIQDQ